MRSPRPAPKRAGARVSSLFEIPLLRQLVDQTRIDEGSGIRRGGLRSLSLDGIERGPDSRHIAALHPEGNRPESTSRSLPRWFALATDAVSARDPCPAGAPELPLLPPLGPSSDRSPSVKSGARGSTRWILMLFPTVCQGLTGSALRSERQLSPNQLREPTGEQREKNTHDHAHPYHPRS